MSVLLGDRKESKFEAITYSIELHDMLILLMQRGFGVKDVDSFVRKKYAYGEISEENFAKYRENDLKSISTNTTNYTEMTVIFYSVTFQSSMTILSMRLPNENC